MEPLEPRICSKRSIRKKTPLFRGDRRVIYIYISLLGQPYESCCCPFLDAYHQEKVIVYSDGRWLKGDKVEGFFQLPKPDLVQSKEVHDA